MRRSFKWALSLTPIVAGSVGTTVYFVSGNSVSNLGEIKTSRENVQIQSQFEPFSPSQINDLNQIPEKQEEKQAPKIQKTPIVIPEKLIKKTKNPEKLKPTTIIISNKQEKIVPQVAPKPSQNKKILIEVDSTREKPQEKITKIKKPEPSKNETKNPVQIAILDKKAPENNPAQRQKDKEFIIVEQEKVKDKQTPKTKPAIPPKISTDKKHKSVKNLLNPKIPPVSIVIQKSSSPKNEKKDQEKQSIPSVLTPQLLTRKPTKNENLNVVQKTEKKSDNKKAETKKQEEIIKSPKEVKKDEKPKEKQHNNQQIHTPLDSNQEAVNKIIKDIERDLEILKVQPTGRESDDIKKAFNEAKNRISKYRLKNSDQMKKFIASFPKTQITEKQAEYVIYLWQQSYAELNPHLVRSSSAWQQWRSEIKRVLNIAPRLQVDKFMRASGGNSFIVTLKDGEIVSVEEKTRKK
ncbi:hypothetical protein [Mesomycoplasma hyopneumoniae]|uniref:Uncharacterized protein n=1 Tax=Mesomycoplasma hyopneumoniae (strain J / ATCC 25934 / NCTC 10110) TaxID=262719 RepID=Q4A9Q5_MESHJ|nr:hypothetical protein [Mesomycoplasma hyopneumoniae]AAZ44516.2 hypothetical protein MHJ_0430 [Mesomycoplasma hyopneumoniae J]